MTIFASYIRIFLTRFRNESLTMKERSTNMKLFLVALFMTLTILGSYAAHAEPNQVELMANRVRWQTSANASGDSNGLAVRLKARSLVRESCADGAHTMGLTRVRVSLIQCSVDHFEGYHSATCTGTCSGE